MQPPRFVFRTNARHPDRPGAVLCRITVDKKNCEFTTPLHCLRSEWDAKTQGMRGASKAARLAKTVLADIAADLNRIYYDMERAGQYVTAGRVLAAYLGGTTPRVTLLAAWATFLTQRAPLVGVSLSAAKMEADVVRGQRLAAFLRAENLEDLLPEEFTAKRADAFIRWMRTVRGVSQNYTAKVVQTIKQVLRWCVGMDYAAHDPLAGYGLKFSPPPPPKFLTPEELERLRTHVFAAAPLRAAADCFLFQCYTGLAYVDLARFRRAEHTRIGRDNGPWLYMDRQKTSRSSGQVATVPLLPPALALLDHYGESLPTCTNQVYNRYLKEIAAVLGLGLVLTSHVGRKTAGALWLGAGMNMEAVSKSLGHATVAITQKFYVHISEDVVSREFSRVYGLQKVA